MEEKRVLPIWLSIILVGLCIFTTVYYIDYVIKFGMDYVMPCVIVISTCLVAVNYCVAGYKKDSAAYFKVFCIAVLLLTLAGSLSTALLEKPLMALRTISFGALSVLSFAKDLGKVKSIICIGISVGCALADFLYYLLVIKNPFIPAGIVADLVLPAILLVMIIAKYNDKKARGSK